MRVATLERVVQAEPGSTVELVVDVVNTSALIDGVTAHLVGLPDAKVSCEPQLLPLFPDSSGQLRLSVEVPSTQPAGLHPLTIEIVSHGSGAATQHVDVDLSVSARPAVSVTSSPSLVRSRRTGRFVLHVANTGNAALEVTLQATREDRRTTARFNPRTLTVEPGATTPVLLVLRGPRMLTGGEAERAAVVDLTARRTHAIPAMTETETEPEVTDQTTVVLRQKPLLSRGLLTALILAGIVALWAAVFLFGLLKVMGEDPLTKTAPASFFPVSAEDGAAEGGAAEGGPAGAADGTAPAGALQKSGLVPPGVGGEISGIVTARSNQAPVGRILVEAFRISRDGKRMLVSSAATQADGTYTLAGLFPTSYRLRFSAEGHRPVWFPAGPSYAGAQPVAVTAQGKAEGRSVVIVGKPATISGIVDPGNAPVPPSTQITARGLGSTASPGPPAQATSGADGRYTLTGLAAPGTYELSFVAEGYEVTKVVTSVGGGEDRLQPSVVPSAGGGRVHGQVTDAGTRTGLGGVSVSTTVAGEQVAVTTPTVGSVGSFVLDNLPTPGTYVLTLTGPDGATDTRIVDLDAGSDAQLDVALRSGTNSVTGRLRDARRQGIGGATVRVGGTGILDPAAVPTTTTLTGGATAGQFSLSGLAPGEYTLTFEREGYASETVPVRVSGTEAVPPLDVVLGRQLGGITGRVTRVGGGALVGAVVTVTNGTKTWTTGSTAAIDNRPAGGFLMSGLAPGSYSVTVTAAGYAPITALVRVVAGLTSEQPIQLPVAG